VLEVSKSIADHRACPRGSSALGRAHAADTTLWKLVRCGRVPEVDGASRLGGWAARGGTRGALFFGRVEGMIFSNRKPLAIVRLRIPSTCWHSPRWRGRLVCDSWL